MICYNNIQSSYEVESLCSMDVKYKVTHTYSIGDIGNTINIVVHNIQKHIIINL